MQSFVGSLARRRSSVMAGRYRVSVPKYILEDLRETFDHFDPNNTGYISLGQLKSILQIFSMRGTARVELEKEVNFEEIADQVSWFDVLNLVTKLFRQGAFDGEAKDLFRVFDKKDRGRIGLQDIKATLQNELQVPTSDKDISDLLTMLGTDMAGTISFDDFRYYFNNIN